MTSADFNNAAARPDLKKPMPTMEAILHFHESAARGINGLLVMDIHTYGANIINQQANDGDCALNSAARLGNTDCVITLINAGAFLDITDENGNTPLMKAVLGNHAECVAALLQAGANKDHRNLVNSTPLIWGAGREAIESLTLLLEAEADYTLRNNMNETALDVALRKNKPLATELLSAWAENKTIIGQSEMVSLKAGIDQALPVSKGTLKLRPIKNSSTP